MPSAKQKPYVAEPILLGRPCPNRRSHAPSGGAPWWCDCGPVSERPSGVSVPSYLPAPLSPGPPGSSLPQPVLLLLFLPQRTSRGWLSLCYWSPTPSLNAVWQTRHRTVSFPLTPKFTSEPRAVPFKCTRRLAEPFSCQSVNICSD